MGGKNTPNDSFPETGPTATGLDPALPTSTSQPIAIGHSHPDGTLQQTAAHIELTHSRRSLEKQLSLPIPKLLTLEIVLRDGSTRALPVMSSLTISQMKQLIAKHIGVEEHR